MAKSKVAGIVAGIVLVAAVAGGVLFFMNREDGGSSNNSTPYFQPAPQTQSSSPSGEIEVSEDQIEEGKKAACVTLRAISLEDYIESNRANGISEADSRITYDAGIAQCDSLGY